MKINEELQSVARRIERLAPSPRNPDRFHEDKSEIVLLDLADASRSLAANSTVSAPPGSGTVSSVTVGSGRAAAKSG